jgi:hypothetical protein
MVTMQERVVNLINQLNMPLIEVSLVVGPSYRRSFPFA